MNPFFAFFRLIRWPNLIFIALTQTFFYFFIVQPVLYGNERVPYEEIILFFVLVASSIFIAAGGYIINDYFDVNIDLVNKPGKLVVDKAIHRRWAILLHLLFSFAGTLGGFYIGLQNGNWLIGWANFGAVLCLWFYSTYFKKQLLSGNVLISLLTAWVVMVVYFFVMWQRPVFYQHLESGGYAKLLRLMLVYSGFAFLISFIREMVKDMEDVEGDRRYGCKTMPIVWGLRFSKLFAGVWMVLLLVMLLIALLYILYFQMWIPALYHFLLIILPAAYCLRMLPLATESRHFHLLSRYVKLVMLAGIISMVFFKFYH